MSHFDDLGFGGPLHESLRQAHAACWRLRQLGFAGLVCSLDCDFWLALVSPPVLELVKFNGLNLARGYFAEFELPLRNVELALGLLVLGVGTARLAAKDVWQNATRLDPAQTCVARCLRRRQAPHRQLLRMGQHHQLLVDRVPWLAVRGTLRRRH